MQAALRVACSLLAAGGFVCRVARGDAIPAACFGSHMVLQRDVPLPIWGSAAAGERVVVSFAESESSATAGPDGRWVVTLPPQAASRQPRPLVIRAANELRFEDVLVGETWLCAGQSNMLMPLSRTDDAAAEIAAAARPRLRFLMVRTAAGGDPPAYTPDQLQRLAPDRFSSGQWTPCTPQTAGGFSAVGYHLARALEESLDVPVGIVCVAVGGSPTEAWISTAALAADPGLAPLVQGDWMQNPALAGWCVERAKQNLARGKTEAASIPGDALGPNHPFKPGFLWTSCVEPLVPLAVRGVAWYQGESNADSPARVAQHASLLPTLVTDWRRLWGRADLPFAVVQLPGLDRPDWPAFRETQRRAVAAVGHAGLVVTIDLGRKTDVHPPDKQPIGRRIAGWAVSTLHGRGAKSAVSPAPRSARLRADGSVVIDFDEAGQSLTTVDGMPPGHFATADENGIFQAARGRIEAGTIILEPADEQDIRRVRYAWSPFPEPRVNLSNAAGLPVTPFEIDVEAGGDHPTMSTDARLEYLHRGSQ
jgi:sialate O-acetylesterase